MAERDSVVDAEPNVEQERIDLLLGKEPNDADPVGGFQHLVPLSTQSRCQQGAECVVVLGDEDG